MTQKISFGQDETKYSIVTLVESDIDLYTTRQGPSQSNTEFLWLFKSIVEVINVNDDAPCIHTKLYDLYLEEAVTLADTDNGVMNATKEIQVKVADRVANEYITFLFLCTSNNKRYRATCQKNSECTRMPQKSVPFSGDDHKTMADHGLYLMTHIFSCRTIHSMTK